MKIKVLKHNSIDANIDDDFQKVINYYNSPFVKQYINEPIEFTFENTNLDRDNIIDEEGVKMFLFKRGVFSGYGKTIPRQKGIFIYLATSIVEDNIDYTWKAMAHEILHAIVYLKMRERNVIIPNILDYPIVNGKVLDYYGNENPYLVGGNFEQQLKQLYKKGYKYFKESEIIGLKSELVELLDKMRGECGFPFIINSGFRTVEYNSTLKDSVIDSEHTTGEGADIYCVDSNKRFLMIQSALNNSINRIGIGKNYLHFGIGVNKPKNVIWTYYN